MEPDGLFTTEENTKKMRANEIKKATLAAFLIDKKQSLLG